MQPRELFISLHKDQRRRDQHYLCLLLTAAIMTFLLHLCTGDAWIWPTQWFSEQGRLFIWQLRLPRALAVMMVGASLAVSGAVMQALFDNPLAEPGLLGVANGAGVGLVLAILFGGSLLTVSLLSTSAVIGALLMTLLLLAFARYQLTNSHLLLVGVALGIVCGAIMTWAVYFSSSLDLRQLMYWMMGGFGGIDWRQQGGVLALLPVVLWLCCQGRALNFIALGEQQARQLGIRYHLWRNLLILAIGLLVGISVALAGVISFIGLVIPHILRLTGLTDQRRLLLGCALGGGSVLLLADIVARVALSSAEIPIGVVTATLGSPVFIWLLTRVQNGSQNTW
ncbi:vitamin B12 ABC transporter permease BtuC [Candidatus Fukatsuia symbiotica]|uniref:Vitamin B12 import system permease protein BtuC n=1 Tax=Candidatus Fukatsuia symbiotica TaxID=1878942 RepID=A0A2U8I3X1_9GAMM|nr:vitamin B12 ABC transporter permease BtuC [Candidatus Fukatsuia symbiotica]AWK13821.1 vitamin B12 ABC transporter permease BtuC [Candidatus Fukatsuia symbiotica]MEA9446022.1 vitamin B12 ABC transporter permease BtuC [Candidatus Fukatsuia symbiotica]